VQELSTRLGGIKKKERNEMGEITEAIKKRFPNDYEMQRMGGCIESELKRIEERIEKGDSEDRIIQSRLSIQRGELNQQRERLKALEQQPQEPARDKDGKPEGGLKYPDIISFHSPDDKLHSRPKRYGVYTYHTSEHEIYAFMINPGGVHLEALYRSFVTFEFRPQKGDC